MELSSDDDDEAAAAPPPRAAAAAVDDDGGRGAHPSDARPGDWTCERCGEPRNFAARRECFKCGAPRPDAAKKRKRAQLKRKKAVGSEECERRRSPRSGPRRSPRVGNVSE